MDSALAAVVVLNEYVQEAVVYVGQMMLSKEILVHKW